MRLIKVGVAALNQTPLDWDGNLARIRAALSEARKQGISVLCLPELCITGYGCEDAFLSPAVQATAAELLAHEVAPLTQGLITCVGLPVFLAGGVFNATCLVVEGSPVCLVAKQKLAGDGIHYEPRWFKPWPSGVATKADELLAFNLATKLGQPLPIGDLTVDCSGVRLGFEICEDAWVAERPGASLARRGVDIILNPSASHFAFGKHQIRERLVLEGSRALGVTYLYSNLVGNEAGRAIYDGDTLIASAGSILARGRRFSYAEYELISATVDLEVTRARRSWLSSFSPQVSKDEQKVNAVFSFPAVEPEPRTATPEPWELADAQKEEHFARAVALGLFDYLRKSRSSGFVVSLSGGADSAACACLVALAVRFSVAQLGLEAVKARLGLSEDALLSVRDERGLVAALLCTVYQPTRNSSETTLLAARAVAEGLGARFAVLDVDALVEGYLERATSVIGRPLTWERDDIALQNIQARVRSPSIWMITNVLGALLLSTSNRSEAAVGYATMDGDTSGGLSPIAGIDKAFLRSWLRWLEVVGPVGAAPIAALSAVNRQQPTAELRPQERKQTDEDDLMPYEVLDAIERAAIRDKYGPRDCYRLLRVAYPETSDSLLLIWVERFFKLFARNQWKRERYAPSFHLDDESLDPKTWCRFPILSGGFERELRELRRELDT